MSAATAFSLAPPPRFPRPRWRRGLQAIRQLIADPDDTAKARDFSLAVGQRDEERRFQRFAGTAVGKRLLAEGTSLVDALSDGNRLAQLPDGSLGRAYLAYLDENGFEAGALALLRQEAQARWERNGEAPALDAARAWFSDRCATCHDLFHVLTGYGTDGVGEATLLAFGLPQMRGCASTVLTFGANAEAFRHIGWSWVRYVYRAWSRGRRADHLLAQPWEDLLPLPLDRVRELTGVSPPGVAHADGILRGDLDELGRLRLRGE